MTAKSATRGFRSLRMFLNDQPVRVFVLIVISLVSGLLESAILILVAQIAASLVGGKSHVTADLGPLNVNAGIGALLVVALSLSLARLALQIIGGYLPARIAADFQARARSSLFGAFIESSWANQAEEREGHLQELMTNQVSQATDGVLHATAVVSGAIAFSALLAAALFLSVGVALVVLVAAALLSLLLRPMNRLGQRYSHELSTSELGYAGGVSEAVRMAEETQVFGAGGAQRTQIQALVQLTRALFFRTRFVGRLVLGTYQSLVLLLVVGGLAVLYWSGSGRVATLGAVVLMLVRSAMYGQQAQGSYHQVLQAAPYFEGVRAAEEKYRTEKPPSGSRTLPAFSTLAFDRVSFGYRPSKDVLTDVSFVVAAGEAVGIVGPSGAGKSTLVQLLLRLRSPGSGAYLVDGLDALEISGDEWHKRVAYVPQDSKLLHATVNDNIRFFRKIDDETVERAARLAQIHEDIMRWHDGYDTVIGQRADAISGGQRQRICLARALVESPQMLVLDEPTSALDLTSEALVQESLAGLRGQLTLFVVAHRLSTLSICDRIMVIVDGKLEAFGATSEIQHTNAFYRAAAALAAGVTSDQA